MGVHRLTIQAPPRGKCHRSHIYTNTFAAAQGKFAEAEPYYRSSLATREKVLGPEHSDVASSLNNWAGSLLKQVRAIMRLVFSCTVRCHKRQNVQLTGNHFSPFWKPLFTLLSHATVMGVQHFLTDDTPQLRNTQLS